MMHKQDSNKKSIPSNRSKVTLLPFALWILALSGWLGYLTWYSNAPGVVSAAPTNWPMNSILKLDHDRPTVLMFIHPQCPCTKSSLDELAKIITHCKERAAFLCIFVRPPGVPAGWERDRLWRQASNIPYVQLIVDSDGLEARRFGAESSGAVQVFTPTGHVVFSGGITGARNHDGDNAGATAVTEWILSGSAGEKTTFVFGCSLF